MLVSDAKTLPTTTELLEGILGTGTRVDKRSVDEKIDRKCRENCIKTW